MSRSSLSFIAGLALLAGACAPLGNDDDDDVTPRPPLEDPTGDLAFFGLPLFEHLGEPPQPDHDLVALLGEFDLSDEDDSFMAVLFIASAPYDGSDGPQVICVIAAGGTWDGEDGEYGTTGRLRIEEQIPVNREGGLEDPADCVGGRWDARTVWDELLADELRDIWLVPVSEVPEDWAPTNERAEMDLHLNETLLQYLLYFELNQMPASLTGQTSSHLALAELPSLLPSEPQVDPFSFIGHIVPRPPE